jgi:4-hydroxythreonine-4-phosphate dehydrogenase
MSEKIKLGLSIGDINGIGLEIILKSVSSETVLKACTPVVYGSSKVVSYHKNIVETVSFQYQNQQSADRLHEDKVNIVNIWNESVNITLGKPTEESGRFAILSLDSAVKDLMDGKIDVLVTAPVSKTALKMAGFRYPGHTEYLSDRLGDRSLMLMISEEMKVGVITGHLPLKEVSDVLTKELIQDKLNIMSKTLKVDFGIEKPLIAILGLNPHAGEEGTMGQEEENIIKPVIIEAKKKGELVMGPFPADGFFGSGNYKKFDGILAMYHDQGLIPFKALSFGHGVNYTAGLSHIRTSPDHGTAYEIAGKNIADPRSMMRAIFNALDIYRSRKQHAEDTSDPIKKESKPSEEEDGTST